MEDYHLLQNQNHPPCNFQDLMELCSVSTISTTPPVTIVPDNRRLVINNNSVSDWRRSFVIGCSREDDERRRPAVPLPPFGAGELSSGDGLGNVDGRNNSEQILYGRNIDPNMDPRKLKRIMSNRVSAQKSRLKKVQYVADMERKLKSLEAHIAVLSPQVELYRNQQHALQMEQKRLNQKILNCSRNKLIKDAEIEENRAEVNRLRELHMKQQFEANGWDSNVFQMPSPSPSLSPSPSPSDFHTSELINVVSPPPNYVAENGERTIGDNGLGRFNSIARHQMVEYKWMPTPGLRQASRPNSNQMIYEMERPN